MLVRVNGLCFPFDFYVINMDTNSVSSASSLSVLLGRPFLKTAKAVIGMDKGSLTFKHDKKFEKFCTSDTPSPTLQVVLFFKMMTNLLSWGWEMVTQQFLMDMVGDVE